MNPAQRQRLAAALACPVQSASALAGGCVGEVYRVRAADRDVVVKVGDHRARLDLEAFMLRYLAQHTALPVPAVIHAEPDLLVIEHVENDGRRTDAAETHAAELLAALHAITADRFGLERDTLIGGLTLPNPPTRSWIEFFAQHRLLAMTRSARDAQRIDADLARRVARLAERLDRWIPRDPPASLVHGDVWGGNVLYKDGRVAALIDPAIHHAHAEVELAFITLFSCFGEPFFRRYHELRPIADGFFDVRRDLYNLFPLLVHARLFGGSYVADVARTLARFEG